MRPPRPDDSDGRVWLTPPQYPHLCKNTVQGTETWGCGVRDLRDGNGNGDGDGDGRIGVEEG